MEIKNYCLCEFEQNIQIGSFTGYASIFGNVDEANEIVMPGAFKQTLEKNKERVVLFQHNPDKPIGKALLTEDATGLKILKGELNLDLELAREVQSNAKKNIINSFSIGYRVLEDDYNENGVRLLKKLDLVEISFVTFPANRSALLTDMKHFNTNKKLIEITNELNNLLKGVIKDEFRN